MADFSGTLGCVLVFLAYNTSIRKLALLISTVVLDIDSAGNVLSFASDKNHAEPEAAGLTSIGTST